MAHFIFCMQFIQSWFHLRYSFWITAICLEYGCLENGCLDRKFISKNVRTVFSKILDGCLEFCLNPIFDSFLSVNNSFLSVNFRDNRFRDKIRDIRFWDKKAFETPVSIISLSRIETPVFEVTGFFEFLSFWGKIKF